MQIQYTFNGNLIMVPEKQDRAAIQHILDWHNNQQGERLAIKKILEPLGFHEVKPEDIGALTSAPCIQDGQGECFGFMGYQVISFLEELAAGRSVEWQKG